MFSVGVGSLLVPYSVVKKGSNFFMGNEGAVCSKAGLPLIVVSLMLFFLSRACASSSSSSSFFLHFFFSLLRSVGILLSPFFGGAGVLLMDWLSRTVLASLPLS